MPLGGMELLILLAIVLLFFGAKRIPELAKSLGKGTREFRKGIEEDAEAEGSDKVQEKGLDRAETYERSEKKAQQEDARLEDQNTRAEPTSKA